MDFKEARRMARISQFAVASAKMAAQDACLSLPVEDRERVGVLFGTAIGGVDVMEEGMHTVIEKGWNRLSPFAIGATMPNAPSFHLSMTTGALGYLGTITAACSSGTQTIGEGAELIRRGWADMMFVGGTDAGVMPIGIAAFSQMRAISTHHNETPAEASRPFDANRDGFVMAEGAPSWSLNRSNMQSHAAQKFMPKFWTARSPPTRLMWSRPTRPVKAKCA